ncbi:hypothetical protein [Methanocalculus sp.]|nr:hypothetical protein [Methanocalculus sp.]
MIDLILQNKRTCVSAYNYTLLPIFFSGYSEEFLERGRFREE